MVAIFCDSQDISARKVINWLKYYGCQYMVFDENNSIQILEQILIS